MHSAPDRQTLHREPGLRGEGQGGLGLVHPGHLGEGSDPGQAVSSAMDTVKEQHGTHRRHGHTWHGNGIAPARGPGNPAAATPRKQHFAETQRMTRWGVTVS